MKRSLKILLTAFILILCILAIIPVIRNKEKHDLNETARKNAPGEFIDLSHGLTHYQIGGPVEGQTVILIHGFSVPMYIWDSTFNALADAGFRVVRFDLYGRGYSSRPKLTYDMRLFTQQVREIIDSLGLYTPVALIGVSMGGTIAAGFVSEYPDLIRDVVLIDPFSAKMKIKFLDIPLIGNYLASVFWIPTMPESQLTDFFHPERYPDWPVRYKEQMQYRGFRHAILSTARNLLSRDCISLYADLCDHNVLLIWGVHDKTVPVSQSDTLQKLFNPDFLLVEDAGHLPQIEQADLVNEQIIKFLKIF